MVPELVSTLVRVEDHSAPPHRPRWLPAPRAIFSDDTTTDIVLKEEFTTHNKKSCSLLSIVLTIILISGSAMIYRMRIHVFGIAPMAMEETKETPDPFDYVWLEEL
jgi:hypothetical protein